MKETRVQHGEKDKTERKGSATPFKLRNLQQLLLLNVMLEY